MLFFNKIFYRIDLEIRNVKTANVFPNLGDLKTSSQKLQNSFKILIMIKNET